MKKFFMLLALCFNMVNVFAQDANADKLREDGDAAMNAKNYAEAATKYGEFLKLTNYQDADRIFNCGFASFQAKKFEDAVKYYDMSIQKKYNIDNAYVGKAMSLRNLNKSKEFTETVEAGLKVVKDKANLEKLLYGHCMKQGQAAQKNGKLEEAEDLFKNVLVLENATYKGNALYSLGAMYYNSGAKILQDATPIATSDPDKYTAAKNKADAQFAKAKEYLGQAVKIDPNNANAKKILDSMSTK